MLNLSFKLEFGTLIFNLNFEFEFSIKILNKNLELFSVFDYAQDVFTYGYSCSYTVVCGNILNIIENRKKIRVQNLNLKFKFKIYV